MADNEYVDIPGLNSETATLLLAAAEEEGDQSVVLTTGSGFRVPASVAKKAGFDKDGNPTKKAAKAAAKEE